MDVNNLKLPEEKDPQSTFEMLEHFDLANNKTDNRILFEIISRKVNKFDGQFDS